MTVTGLLKWLCNHTLHRSFASSRDLCPFPDVLGHGGPTPKGLRDPRQKLPRRFWNSPRGQTGVLGCATDSRGDPDRTLQKGPVSNLPGHRWG